MKEWSCNACGAEIEIYDEYEPEFCCSGLREQCACMGQPINPIFCDKCVEKFNNRGLRAKNKPFDDACMISISDYIRRI